MGHVYIASLLEDQYFADKFEIEQSAIFRKQIVKNMVKMKDINLRELCPILVSKRLITTDEFECLTSALKLESERILLLFQILDTKGPTAHSIFVHCLGEENSHKPHKELFQLISDLKESSPLEKKRKREATDQHYASPDKRSQVVLQCMGTLQLRSMARRCDHGEAGSQTVSGKKQNRLSRCACKCKASI